MRETLGVQGEASVVRTSLRPALLLAVLVFAAWLAACRSSPAPSASPTPSSAAELPPTWVQQEVSWQALYFGDAHPDECRWALTRPARAASLNGRDTSYLKTMFRGSPDERVYVAVVSGDFRADWSESARASTLYLVMRAGLHDYVALGLARNSPDLGRLGALHAYVPQPAAPGVWGHTMAVGGPFPGAPRPLANASVAVWAGRRPAGEPLDTLRSDADGFFTLDLPPGDYVFRLQDRRHGFPLAQHVIVKRGQPVAAPVVGSMR
jgi:hypothetical protein